MIERQRLLELLEELRTGLSGMERVDDQTRSLLQGMTSDIERILEQEKPASREQLDPVHHDLKEMVLRFETEHRFPWRDARPLGELRQETSAAVYWGAVFGQGRAPGVVTRIEREVQTMKLIERHWRIFDAMGHMETVDGEGVVGEQPLLTPGDSFQYSSGCPLSTPSGIMEGHYTMIDAYDERYEIRIPAFSLDLPGVSRTIN